MTAKEKLAFEESKSLFCDGYFRETPPMIDDCFLIRCTCCGEKAWTIKGIKHKRKCRVAKVLKLIDSCLGILPIKKKA